ncbi:CotY/CotZ family spore coat protein [Virgibacillus doumboii]|uniref:CotY/CotZ family spore coat protein n=1 Tax=Virgibacillus doumboii TaxID=2697503 RepID=UPI0013DF3EFC|nr:CotY/CotZ family spore coat protein [Virgibacillus doumboii]
MGKYKHKKIPEQKHCSSKGCVCDVVKKIVKAQDEVADNNNCRSGCNDAIQQLRRGNNNSNNVNTTIPIILYCEGSCDPFIGTGVFQAPMSDEDGTFFGNAETPIFRAKSFVDDSDCCVRLELLLPVTDCEILMTKIEDSHSALSHYFPADDPVTGFQSTGICLTVDLNKFVGITCLDPVTPISVNDFPFA